jgi:hypothetical protein
MTEANAKSGFPCKFLRNKEMYYQSPGQPEDAFSGGVYWCLQTQDGRGPDGQMVEAAECGPGRACYKC